MRLRLLVQWNPLYRNIQVTERFDRHRRGHRHRCRYHHHQQQQHYDDDDDHHHHHGKYPDYFEVIRISLDK